MSFDPDGIPDELKAYPQWVLWKAVPMRRKDGTPYISKVPYQPVGRKAKTHDRGGGIDAACRTWCAFEEAHAAFERGGYAGLGFVFTEDDPFVFIDLDHCFAAGVPTPFAAFLVHLFGTWSERSQSGEGLHLILRGEKTVSRCKQGPYELYDRARFCAMTGDAFGPVAEITDADPAALRAFCRHVFDTDDNTRQIRECELAALWQGDTSAYEGDDSRADLALCTRLAFWTGNDRVRMDTLFRCSGLMRPKWERADYRARTLDKALGTFSPRASLGQASEGEAASEDKSKPRTLGLLLELAQACQFFEGHDGAAYVSFAPKEGSGSVTAAVHSRLFEQWLRTRYFHKVREIERAANTRLSAAPNRETLQAAINTLAAQAYHDPDVPGKVPVFLRSGGIYDESGALTALYIDLADEAGDCIEITPGAWRVVSSAPVRMLRTADQHPLPRPDPEGCLDDLVPLLRTETPSGVAFVLAWLVFALHPSGPYPALVLHGAAGSGKSWLTKLLRSLVDPVQSPVRRPPKTSDDLFINARHNRVIALENVSRITDGISDDLCSIATGAGVGGRTLYTNAEETSFTVCRPILMNGIDEFVTRGDLASRVLKVSLRKMKPEERLTEAALRRLETRLRPRVLGGICTVLAEALKHPGHRPERLPRMADFAAFIDAGRAAFPASVPPFLEALHELQGRLSHEFVESSGVGSAIVAALHAAPTGVLRGDVKGLWERLVRFRAAGTPWPGSARGFTSELRRVEPALGALGVEVRRDGQDPRTRRALLVVTGSVENDGRDPSQASHPSGIAHNGADDIGSGGERAKDVPKDDPKDRPPYPSEKSIRNGHEGAIPAQSEGSKDAKDPVPDLTPPTPGTIVRHRKEDWQGSVTLRREGVSVCVVPFGARTSDEARMVPVEDLEVVHAAPRP